MKNQNQQHGNILDTSTLMYHRVLHGPSDYASAIKTLRKEAGLTQEELAVKVGVRRAWISEVENGRVNIRFRSMINLLKILGCSALLVAQPPLSDIEIFLKSEYLKSTPGDGSDES